MKMNHLAVAIILSCFLLDFACSAAVQNGTEEGQSLKADDEGRVISDLPSVITRFAIRALLLKMVRAFAQYFVDIFLGEVIGARGLSDGSWTFQWPSWLLTGINNE